MPQIRQIDFGRIVPRNGSYADAFEEFSCQIARRHSGIPQESEFIRLRGAGGDGGVECFWRLPNGEEWGWQAKYMFDLSKAKAALDESVATAIKLHPRLTRYTICLPFDLTGPTGRKAKSGQQNKSQLDRFEEYRMGWESAAQAAGVSMKVFLATPAILLDELLSFDPEGGRLRYWFDETLLSDVWFEHHLAEMKASAYPRYTPELRIQTPITEAFEAFGLTEEWFVSLKSRVAHFKQMLDHWKQAVASRTDDAWSAIFPEELRSNGEEASALLFEVSEQYKHFAIDRKIETDVSTLATKTDDALKLFRELRTILAADLAAQYGEGAVESASFRQFQAEYQVSFPAANLDAADEVIKFLEGFSEWLVAPVAKLPGSSELLVLGQAGVGKTHAICDIAEMRAHRSLRTVVLFGERFSGVSEPWEQIRQQLGFDATINRDAMLAALDAAGEASGKPLLFCIDGLNETRPRTFWRTHLPALIVQLRRYEWIRLCISCRTTYEKQVVPTTPNLLTFIHEGFKGIEFDACREFFAHYKLEPPITPILQPEFTNPLFLRLVCEAMKAAGYTRLPLGWLGINTAINAFLQEKNKTYAEQHDVLARHRLPEKALKAFIAAAETAKRPALPWSEASQAIESVLPASHTSGPLIDWLVREGLLIADANPNLSDQQSEDYVRIAFERLGEHLLASKFLDAVNNKTIKTAFAPGGNLSFAISNAETIQEYAGLIEALSIQLPERYGIELPDCVDRYELQRDLIRSTVAALPWRDPNCITERTSQILQRSLAFPNFPQRAFDVALSISTYPSAADAFWLHRIVASNSMPGRDAFWCGYLHQKYEDRGPVEKLIRAAFEVDVVRIPPEVAERWATVLLWFCAAADRRVRDHATKALVRLTENVGLLWESLIKRFATVDDEYIVERCLAAAYGVLLRIRDKDLESLLASTVYNEVLKDSSRFQHATIRDYARSIIELATFDNVLPAGITAADYMPPYESEWPLNIPDKQSIEKYSFSKELPRLHRSCMGDDFFIYTLNLLSAYEDTIDRPNMGRWIFQQVLDMGYTGKRFANYDDYMMYKYGGGRGKPIWAERIGKKYQWIALARLAARLADHANPKRSDWGQELLRVPLTYERGRDIDPSLLLRESAKEKTTSWWLPNHYDFDAASSLNNDEWTAKYDDMPDTASILSERIDRSGKHWIILEAYPEWRSKTDEMDFGSEYRMIWLHLRSYLVPADKQKLRWEWFKKQQFFGRWMPEGAEYHEGFIGEYPWATTFNLYEDSSLSRGGFGTKQKPPEDTYPTCNSLSVGDEYDSYQPERIGFLLPARYFFQAVPLKWNGESGYMTSDGHLRLIDPSVVEPGPSSLLVEADFLKEFLAQNNLAIIWSVVGEKLIINDREAPRLVYSRAHMLGHSKLLSSKPIIKRD